MNLKTIFFAIFQLSIILSSNDDFINDYKDNLKTLVLNDNAKYEDLYNLGNLFYYDKDFDSALVYFKMAELLELGSNDIADIYYNLGNTYFQLNNFEESLEYYKKALNLNSKDFDAKNNFELVQKLMKESTSDEQQDDDSESQSTSDDKQDDGSGSTSQSSSEKKQNQKIEMQEAEAILESLEANEKAIKFRKFSKTKKSKNRSNDKDW